MMLHCKNFTRSTQQIHLADGSAISVPIDGFEDVDEYLLFPEERERLCKFFEVTPVRSEHKQTRTIKTANQTGGTD
jgi:hypothetical protein